MAAADKPVTYGLKFQARSLVPFHSEGSHSRWIVGTNALRDENEIQVLEYDPERESIKLARSHSHPQEVWQIAPSPSDQSVLMTVHNEEGVHRASVWSMPAESGPLEQRAELQDADGSRASIHSVAWHASMQNTVISVDESHLRQWHLSSSGAQAAAAGKAQGTERFSGGAWDPHDANCFCTAAGSSLQVFSHSHADPLYVVWDLRSMQPSAAVTTAHSAAVRDIDFAKQQDNVIVTSGDDSKLRLWDLRRNLHPMKLEEGKALADLGGHSHWVWQARFNPKHDSLILSASSDALVNLWYLPSLAAGAGTSAAATAARRGAAALGKDGKMKSFPDHEDSVYSVAWSMADPWTFAALSYDGRVAVHKVPSQIKYKILI